jgi:hypothetical protein
VTGVLALSCDECLHAVEPKPPGTGEDYITASFAIFSFSSKVKSINSCKIGWAGHVELTKETREFRETFMQDIKYIRSYIKKLYTDR